MTDNQPAGAIPDQITIGPLTGNEWASFALPDDDERNPLPPCCGNLSEARDAIFMAFRVGGDPAVCWRTVAANWCYVEQHLGTFDKQETPWPAPLVKLYETYVQGRTRPDPDEGFAHLLARDPGTVLRLIDAAPEAWDLDSDEDKRRCLARLGGAFVGYVLDADHRWDLTQKLAAMLGKDAEQVADVIDVLRLSNNLPDDPTCPGRRGGAR